MKVLTRRSVLFLVLALSLAPVLAHSNDYPSPPSYQTSRFDEDYGYLRDPARRTDFWDPVKYLPLNDKGDWYLSLGGEVRERYEYFRNGTWGQDPPDHDGCLLQRYMLHADVHFGPVVRVFTQLKSGLESGRAGGPRPTDEDKLDLHQVFLDAALPMGGANSLTMRIGRQELAFGSQRLVSVREGPNVRQSFDGLRLILREAPWRVDVFGTWAAETNRGAFDDGTDESRSLWGLYAVVPLPFISDGNIDLYYLGLKRQRARFDQGTERELRHSAGARLWSVSKPVDYNFEAVFQWGRFGPGRILAWTVASDTGYTAAWAPWHPRIGLKADIASGDRDPADPDLQTFNPLFPKGAYFSEANLNGPANFIDLHPSIELHPADRLTVTFDADFLWRESPDDGIYGNAVNLLRSGRGSRARYIGAAPDAQVEWRFDRHISVTAIYLHFFAGPFLEDTRPGEDVDFLTTWATYKF